MGSAVDEFYGRSETSGSRHSLSQLYLSLADTWVIYDNSRAGSPLLIASGEKERTSTVVLPDVWQNVMGNKQ